MRGVIQRVQQASVSVDGQVVGEIKQGLVLLLGVQKGDEPAQADKLLHKVRHYRIFADVDGKMNHSLQDVGGGLLIISQFTLAADTQKGLRPGFSSAATPDVAVSLYDYFVASAKSHPPKQPNQSISVATGMFGADMQVALVNDGPVTFLLET